MPHHLSVRTDPPRSTLNPRTTHSAQFSTVRPRHRCGAYCRFPIVVRQQYVLPVGLLRRWDERNQGTANYLMDHPDAGTTSFPFAKSRNARVLLGIVVVACFVCGMVFGLAGLAVALPIAGVICWRLKVHPGRDRYRRQVGRDGHASD
jgi:hypothetical protein